MCNNAVQKCLFFSCAIGNVVVGLALALITLTLYGIRNTAHTPKLSLLGLNLPILNNNNTITFKLKLDNTNIGLGIYYRNLNTSFHYPSNQSSASANIIIPAFYQAHRKKTIKTGTGETRNVNWTEVFEAAVVNGSSVAVRIHVGGTATFKGIGWLADPLVSIDVEAVANVDRHGTYASEKGLLLLSSATTKFPSMDWPWHVLLSLVILSNLGFTGFCH